MELLNKLSMLASKIRQQRDAIQCVVAQVGIYPLIDGSLHKEPLKAAA